MKRIWNSFSLEFTKFACCILLLFFTSCGNKDVAFDSSGSFEAVEVIVSGEAAGDLLSFPVQEGDALTKGQVAGRIDTAMLQLQKEQVEATIHSLNEKTMNVLPQIAMLQEQVKAQQAQLDHVKQERDRALRLLKDNAGTQKQVDDLNAQVTIISKQIAATQKQMLVQKTATGTQNRSILSEKGPLEKQAGQIEVALSKATIINPVTGIVLTKYAEEGEYITPGKPLYKIANLDWLNLRAYITENQFAQIKLGQQVNVLVDDGKGNYRKYKGKIIWISNTAEFTPKTIQTNEERNNLVYGIKIRVKNDGYLKIGMYGEVQF